MIRRFPGFFLKNPAKLFGALADFLARLSGSAGKPFGFVLDIPAAHQQTFFDISCLFFTSQTSRPENNLVLASYVWV